MTNVFSVNDTEFLNKITEQTKAAVLELLSKAKAEKGDIFVVGCSSSEVQGEKIGSHSSIDVADAIFKGIYPAVKEAGLYLAAQCCEHLNRAIIIEKEAALKYGYRSVNVMPQAKAGGSFSTICYERFKDAVAIENVKATVGLDIGLTMIGMHMHSVAVPVRLEIKKIGEANIVAARVRPKFIGGSRAVYNEKLL